MGFEEETLPYLNELYRTARRVTRNRAVAEDIVQQTYLRAKQHFDTYSPGSNCRAWLFKILFNVWRTHLKRENRRQEIHSGFASFGDSSLAQPDPEEEFFKTELDDRMCWALDTLPWIERLIVALKAENLTSQEIAEVIGRPSSTVRGLLKKARDCLRPKLDDLRGGEE